MRTIRLELEKIIRGSGFWLCILCTFLLCLTADVYENMLTGRRYSAAEAVVTFSERELTEDWQFCSREVIRKGMDGWLSFFLPIVAAFPCIPLLCDEYRTKYVRYEIQRNRKRSFYAAKLAAVFLGGAMAVTAGYALFSLTISLVFPGPMEFSPAIREFYELMAVGGSESFSGISSFLYVLKILCCVFLAGGLSALPAVVLTSVSLNKYVVLCVPFFLKYGLLQICLSLRQSDFFLSGRAPGWLIEANTIINPDTPLYLYQYPGDFRGKILAWCLILVVFYSGCYLILQKRRFDCGE